MEQIGKIVLKPQNELATRSAQLQKLSLGKMLYLAATNSQTEVLEGIPELWQQELAEFSAGEIEAAFGAWMGSSKFFPKVSEIRDVIFEQRDTARLAAEEERWKKYVADSEAARLDAQRPERQEETKQLMDALNAKIFGATNSEYSGA